MTAISALTDQELDELLAGHTPEGRGELAPLADVAIAVRERTAVEPAPVMAYPLRHAVTRAAAPVAPRPRRLVPVAVCAFALAGISLAGAANALPAPVQDMVAEAGDLVGMHIPHSTDDLSSSTTDAPRPLADGVGSDGEPKNQSGPTPGGATPADPGEPGDMAPATPAIPPDQSSGGSHDGNGEDTRDGPTGTDEQETDDEGDEGSPGNADDAGKPDDPGNADDPGKPDDPGNADDSDDADDPDDADDQDRANGSRNRMATGGQSVDGTGNASG